MCFKERQREGEEYNNNKTTRDNTIDRETIRYTERLSFLTKPNPPSRQILKKEKKI